MALTALLIGRLNSFFSLKTQVELASKYADSLFFSIESYNSNSYSLYFNINSIPGFDYKLSNDSLYSVDGNNTLIHKRIIFY